MGVRNYPHFLWKEVTMNTYRAMSCCPTCSYEHEVWFHKGKIEPTAVLECERCSQIYPPEHFIMSLLELRKDVSISAILLGR